MTLKRRKITKSPREIQQGAGSQAATHTAILAKTEYHSGPLPRASEFAEYEEVLPGAADRILCMAERSLNAEIKAAYIDRLVLFVSMMLGKAIVYVMIFVSLYLIMHDKKIEALMTGILPLITILYGTLSKKHGK